MTKGQGKKEPLLERLTRATKQFIYGMTTYEGVQVALQERRTLEHLLTLITMGDLLGVPILRSYYSLRIIPYMIPRIETWKREMLRERDLTDLLGGG
jgi:cbb3-type cytochrome oxidase subunit 1